MASHVQYQPFAEPPSKEDGPFLSGWLSQYPDWIPLPPALDISNQPAHAWTPQHQPQEGNTLEWTSRYPDWLPPRSAHAGLAMVTATGFPPQFLAQTEGPLDGDVLGAPILLQYDGTVGPVLVPVPVVIPDYRVPIYPDRIPVALLATAAHPIGAWTPQHQDEEGRTLDWWARYPSWLPPPRLRLDGYATSPQPEQRESLDHQPRYPDLLWRIVLPVAAHPLVAEPITPEHTIALDATASYPDRHWTIWPAALWPDRDGRNLEPIAPVVMPDQWPPVYPDWITSPTALRTAAQEAVAFFPTRQEGATQGWRGSAPTWIAARRLSTSHQQAWIGPVSPVVLGPAPALSWRASYPDFARRPWMLRHLQPGGAAPISLFPHLQTGGPVDATLFAIGLIQYTTLVGPLRFTLPFQAPGPTWQSVVQHWLARRLYHARLQQPMVWPLERFRDEQMHWQPVIELTYGPMETTVASGMTPGQQA